MKSEDTDTRPPASDLFRVTQFNAQKFALLLYSSALPEEIKESIIALVPEMTVAQINSLLNILESRYLDEQTKDIDSDYEEKLKVIFEQFEKTEESLDSELAQKIADLNKSL